jgi:hypothetical protein
MGIRSTTPYIPVVERDEGSGVMSLDWAGVFNYIKNTAPMDLTLSSAVGFSSYAEIVIRNAADSTDSIQLLFSGYVDDVSGDLGVLVPPGGIAELKLLGFGGKVSLYGYLE